MHYFKGKSSGGGRRTKRQASVFTYVAAMTSMILRFITRKRELLQNLMKSGGSWVPNTSGAIDTKDEHAPAPVYINQ